MIILVIGLVIAWGAAGSAHEAATATSRASRDAVDHTLELANAAATLGGEVEMSVGALSEATGSASTASQYAVVISQQVRALIDALSGVGGQQTKAVADVVNELSNAEASLLETEGGLNEANDSLTNIGPGVTQAVTTLTAVPDQLRAASSALAAAETDADDALLLWRFAIVLLGAVALFMLWLVSRLAGPSSSGRAQA
ncbi:MAG: hypothetical protein JWN39_2046 [Ilumatobacteraceae bacterium]|nr:hypothetical protein [Ilumatobacteraceae bacterium]